MTNTSIVLIDSNNEVIKQLIRTKGYAIVGSIWYCGDDVCNCKQPKIEKITEHPNYPLTWWQTEVLWEGSYQTNDGDEYKSEEELIKEIYEQKDYVCDYIY